MPDGYERQKTEADRTESAGRQSGQASTQYKRAYAAQGQYQMSQLAAFGSKKRMEEAEEFITQHGSIFKTPSGYVQQVPQVSIAQQNLKIMQSFCSEFGLTPACRARIFAANGMSEEAAAEDPMEKLLKGGWD